MDSLQTLYHLYEAYEAKARAVRRKASPYAGALGLGEDPRNHACHEQFFEDVGCWCRDFVEKNPSEQEISGAVRWILMAADARRNTDIHGYLYAAQSHAAALIPRMPREDALELMKIYNGAYPEEMRLPVQQEVYRLLVKQAEVEAASRRRPWGFFRKNRG